VAFGAFYEFDASNSFGSLDSSTYYLPIGYTSSYADA
jgi:hypothetical protein